MVVKYLFLLISFALAGSRFDSSASSILASFNEKIELGDIDSLKSILDSNSKYIQRTSAKRYRNNGLTLAIKKRHASVVELLLNKANVNAASNDNKAIRLAASNGDVEIVRMLLNRPEVNPGARSNEALVMAAKNGHTEVVRLLLENPHVNPLIGGGQAVLLASERNHPEVVKLIIHDGRAEPLVLATHTLEQAARHGNVDLVRFLLRYPLFNRIVHFVIIYGDLLSIKTLIEAGYIMSQKTIDKTLQYARSRRNYEVVEYLDALKETPMLSAKPLNPITEQCAICLTDENLLAGYMTSCNHQFHAGCLQKWIEENRTCPICRAAI